MADEVEGATVTGRQDHGHGMFGSGLYEVWAIWCQLPLGVGGHGEGDIAVLEDQGAAPGVGPGEPTSADIRSGERSRL
jgi:hypothetical protein